MDIGVWRGDWGKEGCKRRGGDLAENGFKLVGEKNTD